MAQIGSGASTTVKTAIGIQLQGSKGGVAPKKSDLQGSETRLPLVESVDLWPAMT